MTNVILLLISVFMVGVIVGLILRSFQRSSIYWKGIKEGIATCANNMTKEEMESVIQRTELKHKTNP